MKYITQFLGDFITIMAEMAPYLLLGFFFAGVLHAFLPQRHIQRYFNGHPFLSSLYASLLGIPLPLCSCGVIPTGTAFYKNGASKSSTVSFLISTPQTGVDSLLATYALMGLPMMIIRPITSFITGVLGGTWAGYSSDKGGDKTQAPNTCCSTASQTPTTFKDKVRLALRYGFVDFMQDTAKWLLLGLVLAALVSVVIPDNLMSVLHLSPIVQMILILVFSIPFYVCATGSIPLAAMLILKGVSPGAAFILLMAGPATNLATMTVIGKVMGRKTLGIYLTSIIIGALSTALLIDYVFPTSWFSATMGTAMAHEHGAHGLSWIYIASAVILASLMAYSFISQRYGKKKLPTTTQEQQVLVVEVDGMTCNHCKKNVETHVSALEGIDSAVVDLSQKTLTVSGDHVDVDAVRHCVEELGYSFIR